MTAEWPRQAKVRGHHLQGWGTIRHQTFQEGTAGPNQAGKAQLRETWASPLRVGRSAQGIAFEVQNSVPCKRTTKNKEKKKKKRHRMLDGAGRQSSKPRARAGEDGSGWLEPEPELKLEGCHQEGRMKA